MSDSMLGALIWLNGSAEGAVVNFADRHNPRRSQFVAIVAGSSRKSARMSRCATSISFRTIA